MKIAYYFIDDNGQLEYINTKDKDYVSHTLKTVSIDMFVGDAWGCGYNEVRIYPRKGYLKGFKRKEIITKRKPPVEKWVTDAMRKSLKKRFPDIGKYKISFHHNK